MTGNIRLGDSDSMVLRSLQIWFGRWMPVCSLAVVLVTALALGGCGGGDDSSSASSDSGDEAEVEVDMADEGAGKEKPKAGQRDTAAKKPAKAAAPPAEVAKPAETATPLIVPSRSDPARPDSVADWEAGHFLSAKRDRDPRLLDAVAFLGEHHAGDVEVVQLLEDLLLTAEDPEPEPVPELESEKTPAKKKRTGGPGSIIGLEDMEDMEDMDEETMRQMMEFEREMMGGMDEDMMGMDDDMMMGMDDEYDMEFDMEDMMGMEEGMMGGMYGRGRQPKRRVLALTPSYVSLTGGIVGALGANGTDASRQVIENLLAGKLELGDDVVATSAALKALVDNPCLANEAVLYRALTVPETFRLPAEEESERPAVAQSDPRKPSEEEKPEPEKAETVTAQMLRATTLPLIEKSASMRLRVELTKYLFGTPVVELRDPLVEMITASNPRNVAAQIGLYGRQETGQELKDEFETYFTTYSAIALGRILGVSTAQQEELPPMVSFPQMQQPGAPAADAPWVAFGKKPTPSGKRRPGMPGAARMPGMDEGMMGMDDEEMYEEMMNMGMQPGMEMDEEWMGRGMPPGMEMDEEWMGRGMPPGMEMDEEWMDRGMPPGMGMDEEWMDMGMPPGMGMDEGMPGMGRRPARRAAGPAPADIGSAKAFAQQSSADPGLPYALIGALWHTNLLGAVAERLGGIESLENSAQLISLASTVPNDEIRSRLHEALRSHWIEGPSGLKAAAKFPELGVTDPGFLAVVKMLPRKQRPVRRPGAKQPPTSPDDQSSYDWLQTSFDTFKDLCTRFHAAALNEPGRKSAAMENLPFNLPADAAPVAAFQVDWQDHVGDKAPGIRLDTLKVCYVRIEETAQFAARRSFYGREAKQATQRDFGTGVWFDGIGEGSQPGLKRTIDVLITRSTGDAENRGRQAEPLVIEILSVEVKDPTAG